MTDTDSISPAPLARVIREVDRSAQPKPYTEKLLTVKRTSSGLSISSESSFLGSFFGKQPVYYIVANNSEAVNIVDGQLLCTLRHPENRNSVDIMVGYEVSCPKDQEEEVLRAMYLLGCEEGIQPQTVLDNAIKKCVATFGRRAGDRFINDYHYTVPELRSELTEQISQMTKLSFRPWVSLDGEEHLEAFVIQPVKIGVRVQDCEDQLSLQMEARFGVDRYNKVQAVRSIGREFELANLLKRNIRTYLRTNVSIKSFQTELSGLVRDRITTSITEQLTQYGRQIESLTLTSKATVPESTTVEEVRCSIPCEIKDPTPFRFNIDTTLSLLLEDIGKYRISEVTNLQRWAEEKGSRSLQAVLFNQKYIDIVLQFDSLIGPKVERQLNTAAREIGYGLKALLLAPDIEAFELTKEFTLAIEQKRCSISAGAANAELDIFLSLKIPCLTTVSDYLHPQRSIKKQLAERVLEIVQQKIGPLSLSQVDTILHADVSTDSDVSIFKELDVEIKRALKKEFGANVSRFYARQSAER